jgi:hypothetical protein
VLYRENRNKLLGRYALSGDPCQPRKAGSEILMDKEALTKLRIASSKEQSETSGQATDLEASDDPTNADDLDTSGQDGKIRSTNSRGLSSEQVNSMPHDAVVDHGKAAFVHGANKGSQIRTGASAGRGDAAATAAHNAKTGPGRSLSLWEIALWQLWRSWLSRWKERCDKGLGEGRRREAGEGLRSVHAVSYEDAAATGKVFSTVHSLDQGSVARFLQTTGKQESPGLTEAPRAEEETKQKAEEEKKQKAEEEEKQKAEEKLDKLLDDMDALKAKGISEDGWRRPAPEAKHKLYESGSARLASGELVKSTALESNQSARPVLLESGSNSSKSGIVDLSHPKFERIPRRNSSAPGTSPGTSVIYSEVLQEETESGEASQVWRTRPMIMHKVANPLHMHYLQWRLTHCGIPQADLMSEDALAYAASVLPSTADIFDVSHAMFAHRTKRGHSPVHG